MAQQRGRSPRRAICRAGRPVSRLFEWKWLSILKQPRLPGLFSGLYIDFLHAGLGAWPCRVNIWNYSGGVSAGFWNNESEPLDDCWAFRLRAQASCLIADKHRTRMLPAESKAQRMWPRTEADCSQNKPRVPDRISQLWAQTSEFPKFAQVSGLPPNPSTAPF